MVAERVSALERHVGVHDSQIREIKDELDVINGKLDVLSERTHQTEKGIALLARAMVGMLWFGPQREHPSTEVLIELLVEHFEFPHPRDT